MEDMTPAIHEVVAYTDLLEVRGEVRAMPPRRLLDVLNSAHTPYLTIHNASVIPLSRWGEAQPSRASAVVLTKAQIAFVALLREAKVERSAFVTMHKVPQEVILYSGPFVAQGALHIVRERTLGQALDAIQDQFLALTNPSLLCLTLDGLALREMLVLCVNLQRIMAVQVRE